MWAQAELQIHFHRPSQGREGRHFSQENSAGKGVQGGGDSRPGTFESIQGLLIASLLPQILTRVPGLLLKILHSGFSGLIPAEV